MRRVAKLAASLVLLGASLVAGERRSAALLYTSDADGTQRWGIYRGLNGSPFAGGIEGRARIKTSGTSSSITSAVASSGAFVNVVANDVLQFVTPANAGSGTVTSVLISSKGSNDSVSIAPFTVNLDTSAGVSFRFLRSGEGTAATSAWLPVGSDYRKLWTWTVTTELDDFLVKIQCRDDYLGAPIVQIYPESVSGLSGACQTGTFTAGASYSCAFATTVPWAECRWGFQAVFLFGGVTNNSITAGYTGRSR